MQNYKEFPTPTSLSLQYKRKTLSQQEKNTPQAIFYETITQKIQKNAHFTHKTSHGRHKRTQSNRNTQPTKENLSNSLKSFLFFFAEHFLFFFFFLEKSLGVVSHSPKFKKNSSQSRFFFFFLFLLFLLFSFS